MMSLMNYEDGKMEDLMKKKGEAIGELEGLILPDHGFSSKKTSSAFCSSRVRA